MGLTGLDIYKKLPQTNCGDCGVPTCLAFAMKLAAGGASLDACPHVSEEAKEALSEASAPPMREVTIGQGEKALKIGGEQVLFRHDKTFFNPPGFALVIDDQMEAQEVDARLSTLQNVRFDRIGQELRADLAALRCSSGDGSTFVSLVEKVRGSCDLPLVLVCEDTDVMSAALDVCGQDNPLVACATSANSDSMSELAKKHGCPLVVRGESLEELSELTDRISQSGVKDLVLDSGSRELSGTLQDLVMMRRAALKQKFRPLGYPVITFPCQETEDEMLEAIHASVYVMKYGGVMVMNSLEPWKALPLFVLRQNIYTDPQRPMQVQEGFYDFASPDESAPILVTTNFSLTYFIVSSEVEASKRPARLGIVDAEGLSTLTAWAAGKFTPEKIASFIKKSGIEDQVSHRKVVIPGYVAQIKGELEEELEGWEVIVGPREASEIPKFLKEWQ